MDIKELMAQADAKYKALESKYTELTETVKALQAAGNSPSDISENETVIELKNLIADIEAKTKSLGTQKSDDGKSIRDYTTLIVGKFLKQSHEEKNGGEKSQGFDLFVKAEVKTLNLTNPGEGAESVANVLSRQIIERARESYPILNEIGRRNMPRDLREEVLVSYPSVQEGIENVAGVSINETKTQEYREVKNRVCKINAKPRITDEAMYASDLALYEQLMRLLDEEIGRYLLMQCLFGDGTGKNMRGILSSNRISDAESFKPTIDSADPDSARNVDFFPMYRTGVAATLPVDSVALGDWLIDYISELPTKYMKGAKHYMNRKTAKLFRKARDADGNKLLVKSTAGRGMELEDYPVVIDDYMPDVAPGSTPIIFGNLGEAFTISNGAIQKMLLDPYTVDGNTVVKVDQEFYEMIGKNDAIIIIKVAADV
ncbi:putative phage major capsid protein [Vibrio phage 168E36-1]|nr:putative phage major capsid protein [Vibrio phage 168E36-1]